MCALKVWGVKINSLGYKGDVTTFEIEKYCKSERKIKPFGQEKLKNQGDVVVWGIFVDFRENIPMSIEAQFCQEK